MKTVVFVALWVVGFLAAAVLSLYLVCCALFVASSPGVVQGPIGHIPWQVLVACVPLAFLLFLGKTKELQEAKEFLGWLADKLDPENREEKDDRLALNGGKSSIWRESVR